ncbi:MAG: M48 family metalloprotease [Silvibacterium sp.]
MIGFSRKLFILLVAIAATGFAAAQPAIQPPVDVTHVPAAAQPSPHFDADLATDAYMAMMPPTAVARSNAYFEGGYWLILWDFLYASAVSLLLLNLRWSARMRDAAARITRNKYTQVFLYWVQCLVVTTVIGFPLGFYENFVREHKYGMATQSFGPWMGDQFKEILVSLVLGSVAVLVIFAIVRKFQKTWWIWGSLATIVLFTVVFIQPIFNTPKKLNDPKITRPILRMAHANGIPTNDVYEIDVSRQTTRMSANVSGFGKTMRITLNHNLLRRGSHEEIQAVMGHEMGHYKAGRAESCRRPWCS